MPQLHTDRIGKTIKATNGQMMTIIEYRSCADIDVRFEDGTVVQHKRYRCFLTGYISNPNFNRYASEYIGQTLRNNDGQLMTVIAYRNAADIDVRFEDGTIVQHRQYSCFKDGEIHNPNFYSGRIGEQHHASNGQMMTIIAYHNSRDVDVQFDDGTIILHKSYGAIRRGLVHNPNYTHNISQRTCRIGLSKLANNGLRMTISNYRKYRSIDILYETGLELKKRRYFDFERGHVKHPFPYQVGNISMDKLAYVHNDTGNFYCHCLKCGVKEIMTVSEMKSHVCPEVV